MAAPGGLRLEPLDGDYAVCRLDPGADPGAAPAGSELHSVTWTREEASVVCRVDLAPEGARVEGPLAALRVAGAQAGGGPPLATLGRLYREQPVTGGLVAAIPRR